MEIVVGVLLAGVAAFFGYMGSRLEKRQETAAKRALLLSMLKYELRRVKSSFPDYDPNRSFHRDPLRLASLDTLLDGETLSYKREAELIRDLLLFRIVLAKYNDFVAVTNLAQATTGLPDTIHKQLFSLMAKHHALVRRMKDRVAGHLSDVVEIAHVGGEHFLNERYGE